VEVSFCEKKYEFFEMFNFQVEQMKNAGGEQAEQANQVNQSENIIFYRKKKKKIILYRVHLIIYLITYVLKKIIYC